MRIAAALAALIFGASVATAAECGRTSSARRAWSAVGTQGGLEVGLKTYPRTIPLADHEVILTFDDGPEAVNTPKILDALAAECVRATFFEIGRNAEGLPALARREVRTATRSRTTPGRIPSRRCATCPAATRPRAPTSSGA